MPTNSNVSNSNVSNTTGAAADASPRGRARLWWLAPRPFYVVSSAFYLGVLIGSGIDVVMGLYTGCGCENGALRPTLIFCAVAALFVLDRLEFSLYGEETPWRAAVVLFVTRVCIYEVLAAADFFRYSLLVALFLPLLGFWYFGRWVGYGLGVLAVVDYVLHQLATNPTWLSDPLNFQLDVFFVLAIVFTLAMMQVLVREKATRTRSERLLAELAEAHGQLRIYAEQVEELATSKERNRLARDIHDSLGHFLTIINVQLEKALVFRERDAQEADQAVRTAKRLASEALQEVRHSVSALRTAEDTFVLVPALRQLVERLLTDQFSVDLHVEGSEEGYSQQALMTLFRAAQEGLTNVQKYANAQAARLTMVFGETFAALRLSDDGRGFESERIAALQPGRAGGYGLQGARERVELVGGTLTVESTPGAGTNLEVTVPKSPVARQGRPF